MKCQAFDQVFNTILCNQEECSVLVQAFDTLYTLSDHGMCSIEHCPNVLSEYAEVQYICKNISQLPDNIPLVVTRNFLSRDFTSSAVLLQAWYAWGLANKICFITSQSFTILIFVDLCNEVSYVGMALMVKPYKYCYSL